MGRVGGGGGGSEWEEERGVRKGERGCVIE